MYNTLALYCGETIRKVQWREQTKTFLGSHVIAYGVVLVFVVLVCALC